MRQKRFMDSVRDSLYGIRFALGTERNLRIHALVLVVLIPGALVVGVQLLEMALLLLGAGLVITAELFNTAVEKLIDLKIAREYNPLARIAKDVAAGAVLFSSLCALVVGLLVLANLLIRKGVIG